MYAVLNNPFKYAVIGNQMCIYQQPDYTPTVYGYLYNHYAARDSSLIYADGWGVPTEAFTNTFKSYINTDQGDTSTAIHLKSCRTVDNPAGGDCSTSIHPRWNDPTTAFPPVTFAVAGIDSYNFSGVPAGVRYTEGTGFREIGIEKPLWLFDITGSNGKTLNMSFNSHSAIIADYPQGYGQAIRLVRLATSGEQSSLANGDYADDYVGNDGRRYKTVRIGTQIWMAENLAETKYRDGTIIPTVTDQNTWDNLTTGAKCVYDNNSIYL